MGKTNQSANRTSNIIPAKAGIYIKNNFDLVKIGEASKTLGVSIDTLRRWEKAGKIQTTRTPGGTRLYSLENIRGINKKSSETPTPVETPNSSTKDILEKRQKNEEDFNFSRTELLQAIKSKTPEHPILENSHPLEDEALKTYIVGQPETTPETSSKSNFGKKEIYAKIYANSFNIVLVIIIVTFLSGVSAALLKPSFIENLPVSFNNFFNKTKLALNDGKTPLTADQVSAVLAATIKDTFLQINTDASLSGNLAVVGDATVSGTLTAPNILYSIIPGTNISITGDPQRPTISTAGSDETLQTVTSRGSVTTTGITLGNLLNLGQLTEDPSSAINGATYYNTTSNAFRCYKNGSWVACDTDTTSSGDIEAVSVGNGLSGGGSSGSVTIDLDVSTTSTTSTVNANSGLEITSAGLSLLRGCADTEVLAWDATNVYWECTSAGGTLTVKEGGTTESTAITSLDFLDGDFNIDVSAPEADITLAATLTTVTGVAGDFNIAGGDLTTSNTTSTLFNTTATTLSIGGAATTFNIGPTGSGAASMLLSGGSADTGCTLNGATGDLTCTGNITGSSSGTAGFWSRSGSDLQPATSGDNITTSGNISTSGSGALTIAGTATFQSTINTNTFTSTALTFAGSTPIISASTSSTSISLNPGAGGTVNLAGGSGSTGCSVDDTTGNLTCAGTISSGGGGSVGYWDRQTTTLVPVNTGDNVSTSGNISTTGSGTITSAGLLTGSAGLTVTGATVSLNASSNNNTNINTGTSTGAIGIGNSGAGALTLASGATSTVTITNGALTLSTTGASGGALNLNSSLASGSTVASAFNIKTTTDLASNDELLQIGDSGADFVTVLGNGNFGIGDTSPTALLDLDRVSSNSSNSELLVFRAQSFQQTITGSVTNARNNQFQANQVSASTSQTVTTAATVYIAGATTIGSSANITDSYGLLIDSNSLDSGVAGTVTRGYGLSVAAPTNASSNYAAVFSGDVGIGDTTPDALLDLDSSATTGNIFGITSTTLTTGNAIDLTATYVDATGGTDSAIDINLTNDPSTSANTLRGLDLAITDADDNANTLYGSYVTLDNSSNSSTGTHDIYGGYFSSTGKTAGTTTAYGVYATATGADTNVGTIGVVTGSSGNNYGLYGFASGSNLVYSIYGVLTASTDAILQLEATSNVTLNQTVKGIVIDLSSNTTNDVANTTSTTGAEVLLDTISDSSGSNTITQIGYNTTATSLTTSGTYTGTVNWAGYRATLPNITQVSGSAVNTYGVLLENGTVTTGGTVYGIYAAMTGVGAGTLAAVNVGSITGGAGTETALNIGTGWDSILSYNGTTVINGTGQVVGGQITDDSLDFAQFQDTLDLDTDLTLNQTTSTWSQTFTGNTTVGLTYTANSLTSGTGVLLTSSGTITSGGEVLNVTGNSATTGSLVDLSATGLTTGNAINLTLGTALTTGGGLNITGASYNHTGAEVGNVATISFTDASSNSSGTSSTTGLKISPTLTSTASGGAGTITGVAGVAVAPTLNSCTGATCTYAGFTSTTPVLSHGGTNAYALIGLSSSGGALTNTSSGSIIWRGVSIATPAITQTSGTIASTAFLAALGSATTGGTQIGLSVALPSTTAASTTYKGISLAGATTSNATDIGIDFSGTQWDVHINAATTLGIGINGTDEVLLNDVNFTPNVDDGNSLGSASLGWKDLFFDTGAVINFEGGDVTITHSSDTLDVANGDFNIAITDADTVNIDGDGSPTADILQIGNGDVSATSGVDALQINFDSANASGNAIDISFGDGITGNGSDTLIGIDLDAFTYTSSGGTDVATGINIGALTESGTITSTGLAIGSGWDNAINVNAGKFTVASTGITSVNLNGTETTNGLCHSGSNLSSGTDTTRDIVVCNGSSNDLSEWFETTGGVDIGEIVSSTNEEFTYLEATNDPYTGLVSAEKVQRTAAKLEKSSGPYQNNIIGIVSTSPYRVMGASIKEQGQAPKPIALSGKVPLKVSSENGPIQAGDYLTSSSIPGVAMKATKPGQVVGKALEGFTPNCNPDPGNYCSGKIMTFINITYADPSNNLANLIFDEEGKLITTTEAEVNLEQVTAYVNTNVLGINSISLSETVTEIKSDLATNTQNNLETASKLETIDSDLVAQKATLVDVANKQESQESRVESLEDRIRSLEDNQTATDSAEIALDLTPPDTLLATGSATIADLKVTESFSSEKLLTALDVTVSGTFKALGESFLSKTTVAGDLTVDGTFSITEGSKINAFPTLYIQDSPLAEKVDFFNGLVTINKQGDIVGYSIAVEEYRVVAGKTSGSGTLAVGLTEVPIFADKVNENSRIFITPTTSTNQLLSVNTKVVGSGFVVSSTLPATQDITFDWWMINEVTEISKSP
jgi:DNA-binding transcriptional MerR regulator